MRFENVRCGWEKWFLLSSDRHHDSRFSDLELAKTHLEMCQEKDAHVIDCGDFFDAMQGKYDPRRKLEDIDLRILNRMQDENLTYLDAITKEAVDFYEPYADRFLLISKGNHETSIARHNDVDLTSRLVYGLNSRAKTKIEMGAFGGWVKFMFVLQKGERGGGKRQSINLKYFHGTGGAAPVTKGTIQSNRQAVLFPDAQIVVNGHIHESWILALKRERLSQQGMVSQDYQYHVRTGTYDDAYADGAEGWVVETGKGPKPKGAVWLKLYYDRKNVHIKLVQELG